MAVLLFIIGACLGSFYLVVATRLPKHQDVLVDRSRCDNCGHQLKFWELIPIFSYIFLRGKCSSCKKKIGSLNLIIEVTMGILFLIGYLYYGISYEMFIYDIVSSIMIIIFITDFSEYLILDSPLVVGSIAIIILDFVYLGLNKTLVQIASGIGLFLTMLLIKFIGDLIFKRESLGGGDIKFAFVIGLVLGFRLSLCALILSTFLALPYSFAFLALKKNNEVPYGPFLAASLFIIFLFITKFNNLLDLIFASL